MKKHFLLMIPTCVASLAPLTVSNCSNYSISMDVEIKEDPTFHSIVLQTTTQEFLNKGFKFGDSVDITGPNNFSVLNVPYFSGYYVKYAEWILCSYAKSPKISLGRNAKQISFSELGLKDGDSIKIKLNMPQKYLEVEENLNIVPLTKRGSLTDIEWTNFHDTDIENKTKLKSNLIYRGFSTLCNSSIYGDRRNIVNTLCSSKDIQFVIDLADDNDKVDKYLQDAGSELQWIKGMREANKVSAIKLGIDFTTDDSHQKMKLVINKIIDCINANQKVYIHCDEGKDRTGFLFILLHSLAGSEERYIEQDFMSTFINIYGLKLQTKQYELVKNVHYEMFKNQMMLSKPGEKDLQKCAIAYLKDCAFADEQINNIRTAISKV